MGIKIEAIGTYTPPKEVTNADFEKIVETNDEWIMSRTGISKRHLAADELTTTLGVKAALNAFEKTDIKPEDIDLVIATTITPDFYTPSMACVAAKQIGITSAPCMDVNCACTGFVYALDIAHKYLKLGDAKNVLIISAESLSKITDYSDRSTCILFGDGAAACIVSYSDNTFASYLASDTSGDDKLFAKNATNNSVFKDESMQWTSENIEQAKDSVIIMDGQEVYKFATSAMPLAVNKVVEKSGLTIDDIDIVVPHQANIRIVQTAVKKLKIDKNKFAVNIADYGNTSSASIPIAFAQAVEEGRVNKGSKVCLVGFGAGLTYGAVLFEY